ncbi:MAG: LPXTG cell wall anchor domain-containing protein, partial [Terriglobales bacterium]
TDQNANSATQSSSDQSAASDTGAKKSRRGGNLPQTASPLPLIGLLGLGSVGLGVATRKRK